LVSGNFYCKSDYWIVFATNASCILVREWQHRHCACNTLHAPASLLSGPQ
jgi:hypothetical protein